MNINPYEEGSGDSLIDQANFSKEIEDYLRSEGELLESFLPFKHLIEVGCMHGRYMQWCYTHGIHYTGIDVVERYVKEASRRISSGEFPESSFDIIKADAKFLHKVALKMPGLLFFPFNSFGNMRETAPVIQSIKETKMSFLICSYKTDGETTKCRQVYYENSGFSPLQIVKNTEGVRFLSSGGLDSMAYHEIFLEEFLLQCGIRLKTYKIAKIGFGYYGKFEG